MFLDILMFRVESAAVLENVDYSRIAAFPRSSRENVALEKCKTLTFFIFYLFFTIEAAINKGAI